MSILSGFKSFERYIKTNSGYQEMSVRTLAKDVLLGSDGSGNSVETEITNLNENLTNINVYVGTDEKLHFVNKDGADSVLPFNSNNSLTFTHRTFYSYSRGNFAVSSIIIENKWKKVTATNTSNVQYASVFDADTGERLQLHVPDVGELDISSIKKIELRLQAQQKENATASVDWTLY